MTMKEAVSAADLHAAVQGRKDAEARYREVIRRAREQGWTNQRIAMACGVTEGAIRMYLRRHFGEEYPKDVGGSSGPHLHLESTGKAS